MFQGIFEGSTFPSLHAMTTKWVPREERSSFVARSFMGTKIIDIIIPDPRNVDL